MLPQAHNYRGCVITQTAAMIFRVDYHYQTIGTYSTQPAARAAATRKHQSMLRTLNAESAAARAVPEYRDIVSAAAETARLLANRLASAGVWPTLQVYAQKHAFLVTHTGDPASRDGLHLCGTIGPGVPYSDYFTRIYTMGRNAPLY
jgi:hypothetical protein